MAQGLFWFRSWLESQRETQSVVIAAGYPSLTGSPDVITSSNTHTPGPLHPPQLGQCVLLCDSCLILQQDPYALHLSSLPALPVAGLTLASCLTLLNSMSAFSCQFSRCPKSLPQTCSLNSFSCPESCFTVFSPTTPWGPHCRPETKAQWNHCPHLQAKSEDASSVDWWVTAAAAPEPGPTSQQRIHRCSLCSHFKRAGRQDASQRPRSK